MRIGPMVLMISMMSMAFSASISYGLDTDLYVLSGVNIPPNVLVILDNSASMTEVVSGSDQDYAPSVDYGASLPLGSTVYPKYSAYIDSKRIEKWTEWSSDYRTTDCTELRGLLDEWGQATNFSGCGFGRRNFQTGNYRNFLQIGGPGGSRSRAGLANGIINSYVNTTGGVRFAVMIYNPTTGTDPVLYDKGNPNKGEYVYDDSRDDALDANGGKVVGFVDENKALKNEVLSSLPGPEENNTWSPLAETLYDAGTYFQSGKNGFSSPISTNLYCQKNYVLIISDGAPTKDSNVPVGDLTGDGQSGKLDDVAKHLFDLDLSGGRSLNGQNIKTYAIGFGVTNPLLESAARYGGGRYFYVWSSQSFSIAFQAFIAEILKESTSYVAPVVPISQMERTSSGNRMYLAMFKPSVTSFWKGNIKKYGIATTLPEGDATAIGDILDVSNRRVMSSRNQINDTHHDPPDPYSARSYWSEGDDGEEVEAGGIGEVLQNRTSARKIYTYLETNMNLATDSSNAFGLSNGALTPALLGVGTAEDRNRLINFIHGFDAYDDDEKMGRNGNFAEKRGWILGSFIHSRPIVIHYGADPFVNQSVIYAGANDGMLHAFDDSSGEELWAFIPRSLLSSLNNLRGEAIQFFVDGAPKAYLERNAAGTLTKAILIFGLRRGGNSYIALDVTNRTSPKFLWEISPSRRIYQTAIYNTTDYQHLGQSWSAPQIGKIRVGTEDKWVAFIGGGYDENQDSASPGADTKGRALYVVDILTGERIWSYSYSDNTLMKYCIPSDIARVDVDGNGRIDRLYVGDIGGQVWRFDIGDSDKTRWVVKRVFNSNPGSSDHRKIFYPPDVTLEKGNYEMLFFGTGNREQPKATNYVNRLYGIKDKSPSSPLTENNLVDVTQDLLQDPGTSEATKRALLDSLGAADGWYIALSTNTGEKCLSNVVVFYGVAYYTTFTPDLGDVSDVCFLGEGKGRLYALNYHTGGAALNLDDSLDGAITRDDRSTMMGPSIPSGVIITFLAGTGVGYVGVGGGVYIPELPSTKSLVPVNWRGCL